VTTKDDKGLFRSAVRDVVPLKRDARHPAPAEGKLPPLPVQSLLDERAVLRESALGIRSVEDALESGTEDSYLAAGLGRDMLRKLRRGHWVVQGECDLHGLTSLQARERVREFLAECARGGVRCARIVHGKGLGSPGREPVLKAKVRSWLARREQVLAFCQAPASQGGSGALLVLLKGSRPVRAARK
jgi:DNA-nicking Smr family endonuclease